MLPDQKPEPSAQSGQRTGDGPSRQALVLKGREKVDDHRFGKGDAHPHVVLGQVFLKLCQIPAVGFQGIGGESAFHAEFAQIAFDERV